MGGPGSGRKKGGGKGSSLKVGNIKLTKRNGTYSHKGVILKNKKEAKHYIEQTKKGNYFLVPNKIGGK